MRTDALSTSPQRYSARKPHTSGVSLSHGSPAESHSAVIRARTGAVRSNAVSASDGADTMPTRENRSARRRLAQTAHRQRLALDPAEHDLRPHAWRSCAQSERRKSSFIGAFRLLPPQTAVSVFAMFMFPSRLSQLPRTAPHGKPLALPW